MTELDWLAPIYITRHAAQRVRERVGNDFDDARIRGELRAAILEGRVADRRPNWARGEWTGAAGEPSSSRWLWNEEATRCWVVAPTRHGLVVKSVVLSIDAAVERSQRLRYRAGLRR